jgi:hypothetical protein
MAIPQTARIIDETGTLHELSARTESRLRERHTALISEFLTVRLYSAEAVGINQFLETVANDLLNKPGSRRTGSALARRHSFATTTRARAPRTSAPGAARS